MAEIRTWTKSGLEEFREEIWQALERLEGELEAINFLLDEKYNG